MIDRSMVIFGGQSACEGVNCAACRWRPMISPFLNRSPAAERCRGFKSSVPGRSWRWRPGSVFRRWPGSCSAPPQRCGECAGVMSRRGWRNYWSRRLAWVARVRFPPLQRVQLVQLACLEPIAQGLHITHWSSEELARQAVIEQIVPTISARTVRRILHDVDLQPHRTRYWKTSRLDEQFKRRAEQVLWCYANAQRLARDGYWVVCVDEMPNLQALERTPIRRAIPGEIERQEFDYTRHGTVNLLAFLILHS